MVRYEEEGGFFGVRTTEEILGSFSGILPLEST